MAKADDDALVVVSDASETRERPFTDDEQPSIGQWFWLTVKDYKGRVRQELVCITHVGSNYVEVKNASRSEWRIHANEFHDELTPEPNAEAIIQANIERHQVNVTKLLDEVKQLTSKLGVQRLLDQGDQAEDEVATQALVVSHGTTDVKAHKAALIKAKEKTLPDLFKKIEQEHEEMAMWMKAPLVPRYAEAKKLKKAIEVIEQQIFTVELYAGLTEELVRIRDGEPAALDAKIHLMQRRHYMDEECLLDYKAGGMEFKDIHAFERWLLKKKNRERIFPFPRTMVAFQVRRERKDRGPIESLRQFIKMMGLEDADKATFLYFRNGEQYYRLNTAIEFEEQLFPDKDKALALRGDAIWVKLFGGRVQELVSEGEVDHEFKSYQEALAKYEKEKRAWARMTKAQRKGKCSPYHPSTPFYQYEKATPESVYYDDAMKLVAHEMLKHNRVAVVLQGLLDRSPAFQPHPPWQLWTPEGFHLALELVYDVTRALTDGEAPSFRAFQLRLNMSLEAGCYTIGQEDAWERYEAEKEQRRRDNDWRYRRSEYERDLVHFRPYGNPGPGHIAQVVRFTRKREAVFEWRRERQNPGWVRDPDNPGYMKRDPSTLPCRISVSDDKLLNISAYKPGEFLQFYQDPRTRAEYLKWAPWLLAAEDWHAAQRKKPKTEDDDGNMEGA